MNQAELILLIVKYWGGIGALVAIPFLIFGMDRIDEDARGAYVFRPLLVPGILVIWPLVVWRWVSLSFGYDKWERRYRPPRNSHKLFALIMPIAIVVIITTGLSLRQTWPADFTPVKLSEPSQ